MSPTTWFKVDDGLAFHPKVLSAGNMAMGLWVRAGAWCMGNLTDGWLPASMVTVLGGRTRDAQRLVDVGLWLPESSQNPARIQPENGQRVASAHATTGRAERGYRFTDWQQWQPTKAQVTADREATRERVSRWREGKRNGVTNSVTNGVTNTAPSRPVPSSSGLGSQSALGSSTRAEGKTTDQPDFDKIAAELGQDTAWARRVVNDVLSRTSRPPGDVTAYVLAALRTEPQRYQRTPGPPPISRLCDHGRDRLTCVDCEERP